ncbi:hypothetical protein FRP1_29170 (plasmid) [Pseudonocardia sp. EC080625-04]|uniref:IS110 family transposase n=1 Tax=Pseudonocardia sp. EC080625-04 TaxID=1096868 RepID=UPI0006CB54BC|nr:transposase [Pseudonocardia sp. EC080625-04]ALE76856.1 hypothetical protein FRP1_29170 [Pseudonocardia sp. EC080625-04]
MRIPHDTRPRIVVGVDTHKHLHVAVALDQLGALLGSTTITVNRGGYTELRDWAHGLAGDKDDVPVVFGIEGTGSYGAGLASFLRRTGHQVIEVNRGDRSVRRQANAALHWILVVRMRFHEPTIAYVERRTREGRTTKEILRCLKRHLVREIYRTLVAPHKETKQLSLVA